MQQVSSKVIELSLGTLLFSQSNFETHLVEQNRFLSHCLQLDLGRQSRIEKMCGFRFKIKISPLIHYFLVSIMHSICATAMIWTLMHMTKELSLIWNICLSCGWTTAILVNDMHGSNTIWGLSFALEKTIYTHPMSCIPIFISRPLSTSQGIFMPKLLFENFRNVTQQVYFSSYIVDPSFGLLPLKFSNIIYDQTYGSINANSSNDYFTFTAPTGIVSVTFALADFQIDP